MGSVLHLGLAVWLLAVAGCAHPVREHLFSGRVVTHTSALGPAADPRQSAEEIGVQGWVTSGPASRSLTLTFSNQSASAVPMSAVVDEYTAKSADGRVVPLRQVEFLDYPSQLSPGDERTVAIALPKGLAAPDITTITAKLDQGRVVAVLRAIGPREPTAWRVGPSTGLVVSEQARVVRMDPSQTPPERIPAVLEPVGPVAPRSEAPSGTVPVRVEFTQTFGSTLRAEVFWNDSKDAITLAAGDSQLFYVVPGHHEFHAISRLPLIVQTHARVPVVVAATAPVRIELSAEARLTGVELRVRVFNGERRVVDQLFRPLRGGR